MVSKSPSWVSAVVVLFSIVVFLSEVTDVCPVFFFGTKLPGLNFSVFMILLAPFAKKRTRMESAINKT